jgi:hypothetical protein
MLNGVSTSLMMTNYGAVLCSTTPLDPTVNGQSGALRGRMQSR